MSTVLRLFLRRCLRGLLRGRHPNGSFDASERHGALERANADSEVLRCFFERFKGLERGHDEESLHVTLTESAGMLTIPKGGRKRDVPLTQRLVAVLRTLLAQTPGPRLLMRMHRYEQVIDTFKAHTV